MNKANAAPQPQTAAAVRGSKGMLQRKCACGKQTLGGGECAECAKKKAAMQRRLTVGASNDPLEREADRVAERVMSAPLHSATLATPLRIQRFTGQPAGQAEAAPSGVEGVLAGSGKPLEPALRYDLELRFGHDFSGVRVHTGRAAEQSAQDVNANAYTVGKDIVFGAGQFAPGTGVGRRLLAHELTHVVQQSGTDGFTDASPNVLARQTPNASEMTAQADTAEASCDIAALCRLSFSSPGIVDSARVNRVFASCYPSVPLTSLIAGSPCLTPNFGLLLPPASSAGGTSAVPASGGAGAGAGGSGNAGGLSLPSTTIRFNLGPAAFTIDLPASLAIRLPVPFRGAERVVFSLNASTSEFSFSATINAVPHVRIIARAGVTTAGQGSAGLTIQTTRTTCSAQDAQSARSALQAAGERLRNAIVAVQTPPPIPADASSLERTFDPQIRLAEVVGAVVAVNSAIETARAGCRQVPVVSIDLGVRGPLSQPEAGQPPSPSYLGGSIGVNF